MRYVAYAIPLLLSLGVILAGAASWRAPAAKLAVVVGVVSLVVSGLAVWQLEGAIAELMEGLDSLDSLERGLEDLAP